jgi:multiple sugar transport system permease protein
VACTLVGYGFARFEFFGKKFFFAAVIFTLIVPPQLMLIPLYINFRFFNLFGLIPGDGINLLGSYWPFLLLAITGTGIKNGLFIFIMRQFFKGMPKSLEESAYVDGAGPLKTFFRIMVPNAGPVILIVFLFSFVWQYNDLFFTNILLRGVNLLQINLMSLGDHVKHNANLDESYQMVRNSGMLLYLLPLISIYSFLQRYFVESIEKTGIVG